MKKIRLLDEDGHVMKALEYLDNGTVQYERNEVQENGPMEQRSAACGGFISLGLLYPDHPHVHHQCVCEGGRSMGWQIGRYLEQPVDQAIDASYHDRVATVTLSLKPSMLQSTITHRTWTLAG